MWTRRMVLPCGNVRRVCLVSLTDCVASATPVCIFLDPCVDTRATRYFRAMASTSAPMLQPCAVPRVATPLFARAAMPWFMPLLPCATTPARPYRYLFSHRAERSFPSCVMSMLFFCFVCYVDHWQLCFSSPSLCRAPLTDASECAGVCMRDCL